MKFPLFAAAAIGAACFMAEAAPAQTLGHSDVEAMARTAPVLVEAYGEDAVQTGELRLPAGEGPFPVAVLIHGGCWTKAIGATESYMAPLASVLAAHGVATWNIDYRQMGDEGAGWPGTFLDWGAGTDHLRSLAERYPLDLKRVGVVGHSAGAHAALFVAGRHRLPEGSELAGGDPLPVQAVIALDGPGDLALGRARAAEICGVDGIEAVMGGTPETVPERYGEGSPVNLLPLGAKQLVVASVIMPVDQGEAWRKAATEAGDEVELIVMERSGHFDMLAPGTASFEMTLPAFLSALGATAE